MLTFLQGSGVQRKGRLGFLGIGMLKRWAFLPARPHLCGAGISGGIGTNKMKCTDVGTEAPSH